MSTNEPTGGKSTAPRRDTAQTDCQDCEHDREHHSGEQAFEQAKTHNRITGHSVEVTAPAWSRPIMVVGPLPTCDRCGEFVVSRVAQGPSPADASNQPCGCTPTEASD